jgi:hypothetical protein
MAQPSSRQELIDYCKRQLGHPVLEINVADEQIDDLVDDAVQLFQERHFDGVIQTYLKYKLTQEDIDRGRAKSGGVGIATTSATSTLGDQFQYFENSNFIQVPDHIIGINKVFKFGGSNSISSNMFNIEYQLFLNDIYYWNSIDLLTYSMTKTYLEDISFLLTTDKQIRYNRRQDRLYMDIDWEEVNSGDYLIIDCYRALNPTTFSGVWNDSFLKKYLTSLIKRQWGMNLIKFQGVKLPGGIEFNGRQIYDDAQRELDVLIERMSYDNEIPPLDMIG